MVVDQARVLKILDKEYTRADLPEICGQQHVRATATDNTGKGQSEL